jgi:hypothetical protein
MNWQAGWLGVVEGRREGLLVSGKKKNEVRGSEDLRGVCHDNSSF